MTAVRYRVKADDGRYVERLHRGSHLAAAWTVYESSARTFGYNVALAVANRNRAHVVKP